MHPNFCLACIHRPTFFPLLQHSSQGAEQDSDVEVWRLPPPHS